MNPARVTAARLAEMLYGLLAGELMAGPLATQLRELADFVEGAKTAEETDPTRRPKRATAVRAVYEYWLQRTSRNPAAHKLTSERRTKIESRLRMFSVAEICEAIDFVAASDWHRGNNDHGQRYDDITTICMNDTKLETYRNRNRGQADESPGQDRRGMAGAMEPAFEESEETRLSRQSREALKAGDQDAYNDAQRRLGELRARKNDAGDPGQALGL